MENKTQQFVKMRESMEFIKGKIFLNSLFILFVIFAILSFLWVFKTKENEFRIPIIEKTYVPVRINVEIPKEKAKKLSFYADNKKINPDILYKDNSYFIYNADFPVKEIYFTVSGTDALKSIQNIVINLGKNFYYYDTKDISSFKKENEKYILPSDIYYAKNTKYINSRGKLTNFSVKILSIFYNSKLYIIPICFLMLAIIVYLANKDKMIFKFTLFKNTAIWWILILALFIRLSDLNIPFWGDELYTATIASGVDLPFINTFNDPGNPPLFFILAKFWMILFGNSEANCRILNVLFSVFSVFVIYYFVKRNLNKNAGLIAALLFSVNFYAINAAQEFRSYSLGILLALLSAYFLFEIIKYGKNKDFILYGIIASLMANCHYFQILFLINNFLFAMPFIDNKNRLKFFYTNLIAALFFLPYFLYTGMNKGLMDESFNALPLFDLDVVFYFLRLYVPDFLLFLLFLICILYAVNKFKKNIFKEEKNVFLLFIYSLYSIVYLYISAYLFSHLMKPIIKTTYFTEIVPFISISLALIFFLPFKNKIIKYIICSYTLFMCVFYHSTYIGYVNKDDLMVLRVEELIKYAHYDSGNLKNKKASVFIFDYPKQYADYYKNYNLKNINLEYYVVTTPKFSYLKDKLDASHSDVIYMMLHKVTGLYYVEHLIKYYNISLIKTDKDVLLARIEKQGK